MSEKEEGEWLSPAETSSSDEREPRTSRFVGERFPDVKPLPRIPKIEGQVPTGSARPEESSSPPRLRSVVQRAPTPRAEDRGYGFRCSQCDASYRSKTGLRRHYISRHASDVYQCRTCRRRYATRDSATRHTQEKGHGEVEQVSRDNWDPVPEMSAREPGPRSESVTPSEGSSVGHARAYSRTPTRSRSRTSSLQESDRSSTRSRSRTRSRCPTPLQEPTRRTSTEERWTRRVRQTETTGLSRRTTSRSEKRHSRRCSNARKKRQ